MSMLSRYILAFLISLMLFGCSGWLEEKDKTAGWSAQKIYEEAKDNLSSGAYEQAIKYFEKLESRYPYGKYAQQAQLEIAYAYYKSNDPTLAIAACERFIKLHPNSEGIDYAYYLRGLVSFNNDNGLFAKLEQDLSERDSKAAQDSYEAFNQLITRFPNSKYTPDARLRMQYLVNSLGMHEVNVARYYYNRRAYVAAANRAQSAISTFPNSPAATQALVVLADSYRKMGMSDMASDTDRVIAQNKQQDKVTPKSAEAAWWHLW